MHVTIGDRIRLPASFAEPSGEYLVVSIEGEFAVLRSAKDNIKRHVRLGELPDLLARTSPVPTSPITSGAFGRDDGVLSALGYHVGATAALPPTNRQIALRLAFGMPYSKLPVGSDEIYRAEWGEADSEQRFAKMLRCLESFISLHLNRGSEYHRSIREWKADLEWLQDEIGIRNGFHCPRITWGSSES
jgi:hypothetical protein